MIKYYLSDADPFALDFSKLEIYAADVDLENKNALFATKNQLLDALQTRLDELAKEANK